jgi:hypothetical protein
MWVPFIKMTSSIYRLQKTRLNALNINFFVIGITIRSATVPMLHARLFNLSIESLYLGLVLH